VNGEVGHQGNPRKLKELGNHAHLSFLKRYFTPVALGPHGRKRRPRELERKRGKTESVVGARAKEQRTGGTHGANSTRVLIWGK